jgi:hypothetical protein
MFFTEVNRDAEVHELHPLSEDDDHIAGECHECEHMGYAPVVGCFTGVCEHDVGILERFLEGWSCGLVVRLPCGAEQTAQKGRRGEEQV